MGRQVMSAVEDEENTTSEADSEEEDGVILVRRKGKMDLTPIMRYGAL